ncbi:hypothetical protein [Streptomyces canus]|uniref:hypothetical protein n=1 Tax=Streptomyces canus TaxID=58343 RepID=UPI0038682DD3|nr:hypothetical protein OH824_38035 [Streptomyces canus]
MAADESGCTPGSVRAAIRTLGVDPDHPSVITAAALAPFADAALAVPFDGYGPLFVLLATVSVAAALIAP